MNKKKRLVIGIIGIAAVLVVLGTTVAYFLTNPTITNKEVLTVNTGSLSLIFEDGNDGMQVKSLMLGESVSKEVKITNNGTFPVTTNLNWKDLTNTFYSKSLSYKLEYKTTESEVWKNVDDIVSNNVPKSLSETEVTLAKDITIPNGKTYYYKVTITLENLEGINQESDRKAMLSTRFSLGEFIEAPEVGWVPEAVTAVLSNQTPEGVHESNPTFGNVAVSDEGVFSMEDDYGTSYYYRGAVTNNYVKFGGFYWRIIRINGDGSLRMIYDGTSYHANGESNADRYTKTGQPFNAKYDDAKYVGYMFGGSSKDAVSTSASDAQTNTYDSDIKTVVDEWYENNILTNAANGNTNISKYLEDSVFCNDRTVPEEKEIWYSSQDSTHSNLGWAKHITPYGAFSRFMTTSYSAEPNPMPTFKCSDNLTTGNANNDRFTTEETELGNGALKYPIGLITTDEVVAAGSGKYNTSNWSYYLYKGASFNMWLFSPYFFHNYTRVMIINANGGLAMNSVDGTDTVAPVINLKPEYAQQLIGTGVENDEYRLPNVQ